MQKFERLEININKKIVNQVIGLGVWVIGLKNYKFEIKPIIISLI